MLVFVLNQQGKPLMPCKPSKAKKLLREGKAKVIKKTPFTIKLLYGSSGYKQAVVAGMDTGSCQKGKLHVHHIVFRSQNGTDMPDNLITLCKSCHDQLHQGEFKIKGVKSKTKQATEIGIVKSQLKKSFGAFIETFGYETKFKREHYLNLPKTHYFDAVAICLTEGEQVIHSDGVLYKKHVAQGDYQQTNGSRSEKRIPTGKLFGLKKFDLVKTSKGIGFIKGKRSSGFFALMDIFNNTVTTSVNVKKACQRLTARTGTLI
jgi:hypothetical protein